MSVLQHSCVCCFCVAHTHPLVTRIESRTPIENPLIAGACVTGLPSPVSQCVTKRDVTIFSTKHASLTIKSQCQCVKVACSRGIQFLNDLAVAQNCVSRVSTALGVQLVRNLFSGVQQASTLPRGSPESGVTAMADTQTGEDNCHPTTDRRRRVFIRCGLALACCRLTAGGTVANAMHKGRGACGPWCSGGWCQSFCARVRAPSHSWVW
jgi:hypothetical protein